MSVSRALEVVMSSDPKDIVSFLVSFLVADELATVAGLSADSRRAELLRLYADLKRPLISAFSAAGIDVANALEGSPGIIATGEARAWKEALPDPVFDSPKIRFRPNGQSWQTID